MVAIHVAIVLLVGGGISYSAIRMLHDLGDDQGKTRVQLAGAMAREDLRRSAEDALTSARAVAERPTLLRLLAEGRTDAIAPLLRRLCDTAGVDACAVFSGTQLVAQSGPALDWNGIITSSSEQGSTFLALPANVRTPVMGAYANVGTGEGNRLFVARLFNDRLEKMLSQRVGLEIKLIDYRSFTNDPVNAFTPLYSASLADGRSAVQRINSKDLYASSVPVFASTGEAIALLEAQSADQRDRYLRRPADPETAPDRGDSGCIGRIRRFAADGDRCRPREGAHGSRSPFGPGRLLNIDSSGWRRRSRDARANNGRHAAQPRRPDRDTTPPRGRGAGSARRDRRRRLRRRQEPHHPLPEPAGSSPSERNDRAGCGAVLR